MLAMFHTSEAKPAKPRRHAKHPKKS
jgi:hypothetical protein